MIIAAETLWFWTPLIFSNGRRAVRLSTNSCHSTKRSINVTDIAMMAPMYDLRQLTTLPSVSANRSTNRATGMVLPPIQDTVFFTSELVGWTIDRGVTDWPATVTGAASIASIQKIHLQE